MRKFPRLLLPAAAIAAAGAGIYTEMKRKQDQAEKEGRHVPYGPYEAVLKRPLDVLLSGTALMLLSPVVAVTGMLVKLKLGSPVLFTQDRPGLNGEVFRIYKYRTMTDAKDSRGELLPDEERLTGFGKLLRSTSLDELPELINILKGDMSVIGPRPLLVEYLERYDDRQKHRHDVRPGLTGLAQVSGRNSLSWEERFEDDVKYVEKITFFGDVKILFDTVKVVLRRDGIHSDTSCTMDAFMGNAPDNPESIQE